MTRIESKLAALRRRVSKGTLEVEHLLEFAVLGDPRAATFIKELATAFAWPRNGKLDGNLYVPLARWAEVVSAYLEGGCDALVAYARRPEEGASHFAIAVLGELQTPESICALAVLAADIGKSAPKRLEDSLDLADAINLRLSFKDRPKVANNDAIVLRDFLHKLLCENLAVASQARILCALRGVGNEVSVRLVSDLPPFEEPWAGLQSIVCTAIRKRLRSEGIDA